MQIRPRRRNAKDNPYTLINFSENNKYAVKFKDSNCKESFIEITEEIYNEFNKFELDDLSEMNEYDRHIEHLSLNENILNKRKFNKNESLENCVIKQMEFKKLYEAINKLPKLQKDRIIKYYFENMTQKEIAKSEECSIRAVQYTINIALRNLKKFLK